MDHRRVLAWADTHIERFDEIARGYIEKHPAVLVTKRDDQTGENVVSLKVRRLPEEDTWTFIIGDAIHNMRVSLDYLAFKIVKPPLDDLAMVRRTLFPIAGPDTDWSGLANHRLPRVTDEVRNAFKALQPNYGSDSPRLQPLYLLDALENVHKHRYLLDAFPAVTSLGFNLNPDRLKLKHVTVPFGPVEDGKEIYRYPSPAPGDPKSDVKFQVRTQVCFDREGPARGQIVVTALKDIRDHIRDVVFPALEPFA